MITVHSIIKKLENTTKENRSYYIHTDSKDEIISTVKYNNKEYQLADMSKVLFEDGWIISAGISQTYDLINPKYPYSLEVKFLEGSIDNALDIEKQYGDINNEEVINILKRKKLYIINIISENEGANSDNISISGISLKTPIKEVSSKLPSKKSMYDYDDESYSFQRMNDLYSLKIEYYSESKKIYKISLVNYED